MLMMKLIKICSQKRNNKEYSAIANIPDNIQDDWLIASQLFIKIRQTPDKLSNDDCLLARTKD